MSAPRKSEKMTRRRFGSNSSPWCHTGVSVQKAQPGKFIRWYIENQLFMCCNISCGMHGGIRALEPHASGDRWHCRSPPSAWNDWNFTMAGSFSRRRVPSKVTPITAVQRAPAAMFTVQTLAREGKKKRRRIGKKRVDCNVGEARRITAVLIFWSLFKECVHLLFTILD